MKKLVLLLFVVFLSVSMYSQNNLDYLKNYDGKYPRDVQLFEKGELNNRIKKMLGNYYSKFKLTADLQTPLEVNCDRIFISQAKGRQHDEFRSLVFIDIKNNDIFVALLNCSEVKEFTEKSASRTNVQELSWWVDAAFNSARENKKNGWCSK